MSKLCIYTAIYGGYDDLKPVIEQDVPCDFLCFTDDPNLKNPGGWKIIHAPASDDQHPRMRAKFFKLLNHRIFDRGQLSHGIPRYRRWLPRRGYSATIWIDGSVSLKSASFAREFAGHVGKTGWAMFRHPDRNCIYSEADVSKGMEKYFSQRIDDQIDAYRAEGYPPRNGLFACTMIARSALADLKAIESSWWAENNSWTYQDQLSLPVVLWRSCGGVDLVEKNLWKNDWFEWVQHKSLY